MTTNTDILNVDLPKWPAIVVVGEKVTERQASEILIQTDAHLPDFRYASNDKQFEQQLNSLFGVPYSSDLGFRRVENIHAFHNGLDELHVRLKTLDLCYLTNSRIVSNYIGGPHGWCNWSGDIFCNTFNIGKWPSVEEVNEDWETISSAFPFLNLTCQLFNKEHGEDNGTPIVEFVVKEGSVTVQRPTTPLAPPVDTINDDVMNFLSPNRERGITVSLLQEKLEQVYGTIPQFE